MKTLHFIPLFLVLLFQACGTSKTPTSVDAQTNIQGTYYGEIPCADCSGINYELTLNNDNSYVETNIYQGENESKHIEKGTYNISKKGVVTLNENNQKQFHFENDKLIMLDASGNKVTGDLAKNYVLVKKTQHTDIPILKAIFRGHGTEPFWGIEVQKDGKLIFYSNQTDNKSLEFLNTTTKALKDGRGTIYEAKSAAGSIVATFKKENCTDGMADKTYAYKVNVQFTKSGEETAHNYNGCGEYIANYRLHDIWALESIDGKPIDKTNLPKGVPTMELNLVKGKVNGMAGCNQYGGNIKVGQGEIVFSSMYATKMACENMEIEGQFLNAVSDKTMRFTLSKGLLTLKAGATTVVLKKVD